MWLSYCSIPLFWWNIWLIKKVKYKRYSRWKSSEEVEMVSVVISCFAKVKRKTQSRDSLSIVHMETHTHTPTLFVTALSYPYHCMTWIYKWKTIYFYVLLEIQLRDHKLIIDEPHFAKVGTFAVKTVMFLSHYTPYVLRLKVFLGSESAPRSSHFIRVVPTTGRPLTVHRFLTISNNGMTVLQTLVTKKQPLSTSTHLR